MKHSRRWKYKAHKDQTNRKAVTPYSRQVLHVDVPPAVLEEARRAYENHSIIDVILGNPPPGRSALDKLRAAAA